MVPTRTCVGCRSRAPKGELLRIVRMSDASLRIDPRGTAQHRGTYVHRDRACVDAALKGGIARGLRTGPSGEGFAGEPTEELSRLRAEIEQQMGAS